MTPEIGLTLVGHLSDWGVRMRVDAPGMLWTAWLRHAAHGLLGIYVLPKSTPIRATVPEQTWAHLQGLLRPQRVAARTDADPRSEWEGTHTPLLIHATSIIVGADAPASPMPEIRLIQVKPGRWIGSGYLGPGPASAGRSDLYAGQSRQPRRTDLEPSIWCDHLGRCAPLSALCAH